MAFDVSNLEEYVKENLDDLITTAVFRAPSISLFTINTGIKYKEKVYFVDTSVEFGDCKCSFDPKGKTSFTDREIEVGCIDIQGAYCDHDLQKVFLNQYVRITAGFESLGRLEGILINSILADVSEKLEIAIYQGDKDSADPNLNKFDGLIKVLTNSLPAENILPEVAGESYYQTLLRAYAAVPSAAFRRGPYRGDVAILVGNDVYRQIIAYFTAKTIVYTTNPIGEDDSNGTLENPWFLLPGTNVRVYGTEGLTGTNRIIAGSMNNIIYGTDLESDWETIKFWYSDDNQRYQYVIKFRAGIQVGLPGEMIMGTFAADADNTASLVVNANITNTPLDVRTVTAQGSPLSSSVSPIQMAMAQLNGVEPQELTEAEAVKLFVESMQNLKAGKQKAKAAKPKANKEESDKEDNPDESEENQP